ncbi:nucleoside-diphosphate kinase [Candidatus Woesearchaeota archaeon]|nr:nucleoside-diphosphate kinase [Candidatus Woesearchaeota archaeon]
MIQRTLVLLKPDAVERGLTGEILTRFEKVGLKTVGMKMVWIDRSFSKQHYSEHVEKKFYPGLEAYITSGPVIAMVLEGVEVVDVVRKIVGETEPKKSLPGTIRGDYAHHSYAYSDQKGISIKNLVHASGSLREAKKEVALWFTDKELHSYKTVHEVHVQ